MDENLDLGITAYRKIEKALIDSKKQLESAVMVPCSSDVLAARERPPPPSVLLLAACTPTDATTTEGPGDTGGTGPADTSGLTDGSGPDLPTGDGEDSSGAGPAPTSASDSDSADETTGEAKLSLELVGAGTVAVDPPGESCAEAQCSFLLPPGMVTLTAAPSAGGHFVAWSGDCDGADPQTAVLVQGSTSCTATFEALPDGALPVAITASREVVRVPAADAPLDALEPGN